MIAGLSLGSDNKRYFRGKLPRLAIGTIILMPLLYGAMYLWAFWNPFSKVDDIPAAIVNLDQGSTLGSVPVARPIPTEACHSWLNRNRGILVRWSKKEENHLAMLRLASGLIAFKKAHRARLAADL